jgi:SAM-dependent methyltransferase
MQWLRQWLAHPLTRGLDLDDPQTTQLRRIIIKEKTILRECYSEWYREIKLALPDGRKPILELGSGAGFLRECISNLITSDIFLFDGIEIVLDGRFLPFRAESLRSIVMTNVFHHIPDARKFLREAARCIQPGGTLILLEPWITPWSKFVYTKFHHEPINIKAEKWEFPSSGPLSGANEALPWIIFQRDRSIFEQEFPQWQIETIHLTMPFLYLVSGGVSMRNIIPVCFLKPFQILEKLLSPWKNKNAMFALILLRRII